MCQIKFIHTVIYNQLQSKNRHYYIYTIDTTGNNKYAECLFICRVQLIGHSAKS